MNFNPWNWKSWIRICRIETHYLYLVYIYADWRTFLILVWQLTSVFCIQRKGHLNSEWIYEDIDFQKQQRKYWKDFCHENFDRHNFADQLNLFKPGGGPIITHPRIQKATYLQNKNFQGRNPIQNFRFYFGKSMYS